MNSSVLVSTFFPDKTCHMLSKTYLKNFVFWFAVLLKNYACAYLHFVFLRYSILYITMVIRLWSILFQLTVGIRLASSKTIIVKKCILSILYKLGGGGGGGGGEQNPVTFNIVQISFDGIFVCLLKLFVCRLYF